jgi:hypothetical protein
LRLDQPIEASEQRCFSGATLTDQRRCAPCGYVETYVVESNDVAEAMSDMPRRELSRHSLIRLAEPRIWA